MRRRTTANTTTLADASSAFIEGSPVLITLSVTIRPFCVQRLAYARG